MSSQLPQSHGGNRKSQQYYNGDNRPNNHNNSTKDNGGTRPNNQRDDDESDDDRKRGRRRAPEKRSNRMKGLCVRCGQPGHTWRYCRNPCRHCGQNTHHGQWCAEASTAELAHYGGGRHEERKQRFASRQSNGFSFDPAPQQPLPSYFNPRQGYGYGYGYAAPPPPNPSAPPPPAAQQGIDINAAAALLTTLLSNFMAQGRPITNSEEILAAQRPTGQETTTQQDDTDIKQLREALTAAQQELTAGRQNAEAMNTRYQKLREAHLTLMQTGRTNEGYMHQAQAVIDRYAQAYGPLPDEGGVPLPQPRPQETTQQQHQDGGQRPNPQIQSGDQRPNPQPLGNPQYGDQRPSITPQNIEMDNNGVQLSNGNEQQETEDNGTGRWEDEPYEGPVDQPGYVLGYSHEQARHDDPDIPRDIGYGRRRGRRGGFEVQMAQEAVRMEDEGRTWNEINRFAIRFLRHHDMSLGCPEWRFDYQRHRAYLNLGGRHRR